MDLEEYLARIGAARPGRPDLAALRELQWRHLTSVPFENLGRFLGERPDLDEPALLDKIVRRRRGGLCYELNGAFALLLTKIGFRVRLLAGRVLRRTGTWGPPLDHLALRVDLDEPWLVDVGFGRFCALPLRFGAAGPQRDPAGVFTVRPTAHGDVELTHDGTVIYRLETRPRELGDFAAMVWYHANSPDSPFAAGPTCSLTTPGGRVTIAGDRLIETTGGERVETVLAGDALAATYRERFGISLDQISLQQLIVTE